MFYFYYHLITFIFIVLLTFLSWKFFFCSELHWRKNLMQYNGNILQFGACSLFEMISKQYSRLWMSRGPLCYLWKQHHFFLVYWVILGKNTAALKVLLTLKSGLFNALYLGSYKTLKKVRLFSGITERSCACVRSKALTSFFGSGCSCNNNNDKKDCG